MAGKSMDQGMAQLRESGAFDADLVESLWSSYKGDLVIAASIDFAGLPQAMQVNGMPSFGLVIALTPDGAYDHGKLHQGAGQPHFQRLSHRHAAFAAEPGQIGSGATQLAAVIR